MTTVTAIRPEEVLNAKQTLMPECVLESFNTLIAENFNGRYARILQKDVIAKICAHGHSRDTIFDKHWLDVEDIYRAQGWKVEYDKPGYCESYDASFTFSIKN